MPDAVFAIPGDLSTPTGGYIYDKRVMELLPGRGVRVHHLVLPGSFPDPSEDDLAETARLVAAAPTHAVLIVDGLAFGALRAATIVRFVQPVVALVHHPLALETGLPDARRRYLEHTEREALALAQHVIVTSPRTAQTVAALFGLDPCRVTCAVPGTDAAPRAIGGGAVPHLIAVGAVVPRKGYDVLVQALAQIAEKPWRLTIAGTLDRAPAHVDALRADIVRLGLSARVHLAGALTEAELDTCYATADVFVSSSWYEGFGMVLTEAMARGLPIIATTGGAAADTVPDAAAIKVAPGDANALAQSVGHLLADAPRRRRLADASYAHAQVLPRWSDTADTIAAVIQRVARQAASA